MAKAHNIPFHRMPLVSWTYISWLDPVLVAGMEYQEKHFQGGKNTASHLVRQRELLKSGRVRIGVVAKYQRPIYNCLQRRHLYQGAQEAQKPTTTSPLRYNDPRLT